MNLGQTTLGRRGAWHGERGASTALFWVLCGFPGTVFSFLKRDCHDPIKAEALFKRLISHQEGTLFTFQRVFTHHHSREKSILEELIRNREALGDYLKKMIIDTLKLEDLTVEQIDSYAPLFREGLGLDSIDALELVVAIEKIFHIIIEDEDVGKRAFASIDALAGFIQEES